MSVVTTAYGYKEMGVAGIQELGKVTETLIPLVTDGAVKITESLGEKAISVSAQVGKEAAKELGSAAVDSSKLGLQAIEKVASVGNGMVVVAGVGVVAYSVTQLYPIGQDLVSYFCPSEEQKKLSAARLASAQYQLDVLNAESDFRKCLLTNWSAVDRGCSLG